MKTITILTPCFNEDANMQEVYDRVPQGYGRHTAAIAMSTSSSITPPATVTVETLRRIAASDTNVMLIVNARNFGHIRSPIYGASQGHTRYHDRDCGRPLGLPDIPDFYPRVACGHDGMHQSIVTEWQEGGALCDGDNSGKRVGLSDSRKPAVISVAQRVAAAMFECTTCLA
jgi:hypothetical protein